MRYTYDQALERIDQLEAEVEDRQFVVNHQMAEIKWLDDEADKLSDRLYEAERENKLLKLQNSKLSAKLAAFANAEAMP